MGGRVARRLAERGLAQRPVVRDPSRAPELKGAEVAQASDYEARYEMQAALGGAQTLFLVSAEEAQNRVEQHKAAVDAAKAAGVERIVYLSFYGARPDSTFTFARHHFHTEEHIKASGLSYAFSRDNIYLDFVPFFAGADGVIRGPGGEGRVRSESTRLNSCHTVISYAVFCLKKKKKNKNSIYSKKKKNTQKKKTKKKKTTTK